MEPTLLLIGVLTSAGVVYLAIRLGWLRNGWARVAVAAWVTGVVMLACLPLCASIAPGGFWMAAGTGWPIAWVLTLVCHQAALEARVYPLELPPGVLPRATARRMGATWTPAQETPAARVQAGMGKKQWKVEELP